jgi:hypothetical protein
LFTADRMCESYKNLYLRVQNGKKAWKTDKLLQCNIVAI